MMLIMRTKGSSHTLMIGLDSAEAMTKISTNQVTGEDNSRIDNQPYEYEEAAHIIACLRL